MLLANTTHFDLLMSRLSPPTFFGYKTSEGNPSEITSHLSVCQDEKGILIRDPWFFLMFKKSEGMHDKVSF